MIPKYQCGVCGFEETPELVAQLAQFGFEHWVVHRMELKGGVIQVMTCPNCNSLTQDLILESYKQRLRDGIVRGYH